MVVTIIDYSPLWKTMEYKGISQYTLLKNGIDNKTLEKICKILDCQPNDVVRFD